MARLSTSECSSGVVERFGGGVTGGLGDVGVCRRGVILGSLRAPLSHALPSILNNTLESVFFASGEGTVKRALTGWEFR